MSQPPIASAGTLRGTDAIMDARLASMRGKDARDQRVQLKRNISMRKLMSILLVVAWSLLLIGCGSAEQERKEPPPGSGEDAIEDTPDPSPTGSRPGY